MLNTKSFGLRLPDGSYRQVAAHLIGSSLRSGSANFDIRQEDGKWPRMAASLYFQVPADITGGQLMQMMEPVAEVTLPAK